MTRPAVEPRKEGRGTQAAITRALRAAKAAGVEVASFEVEGAVVRVYARVEGAPEDERTEAEKWLDENGAS